MSSALERTDPAVFAAVQRETERQKTAGSVRSRAELI